MSMFMWPAEVISSDGPAEQHKYQLNTEDVRTEEEQCQLIWPDEARRIKPYTICRKYIDELRS